MARALRIAMVVFGVLYALALTLFLIGLFGLFGQERDPLSAVFLLPLGLPWNLLADEAHDPVAAWGIAFAPWVNIALFGLSIVSQRRDIEVHPMANRRNGRLHSE